MTRVKDVAIVNRAALPEATDPDRAFRYLDIASVDRLGRMTHLQELRFDEAPSRARRLVQPGDSIVSTVRTYLRAVAQIGADADDLVVSTGFATLTPRPGVDPRWLYWALRSATFIEDVVARSVGVSYPAITATELATISISVPPIDVQRQIAGVLDAETARIDDSIEELEYLQKLTHEDALARQTALALQGSQAAPSRPSGHDWMGSIPAHWRVSRLKFEARLESGHTPARSRPELWIDCTIPWVSLNDVGTLATVEFLHKTTNLISEEGIAASSARVLPAGTVVVSRDATIGRCGILGVPMATSQHFANWICSASLEPRYLWLVFRTAMQPHFDSLTDGATLRTIGIPDMKNLVVPVPPVDEQRAIVERAALVREHEAALVDEIETQIDLLREHRQALITAAATGGLDALDQVA